MNTLIAKLKSLVEEFGYLPYFAALIVSSTESECIVLKRILDIVAQILGFKNYAEVCGSCGREPTLKYLSYVEQYAK